MNKLIDEALKYRKLGFSIIPVGKDKKPLIQWQRYQKEKASAKQIKDWWKKWPDANIGIITGTVSGLAVIDIDTDDGKEEIQKYIPDSLLMPTVNTPSGGQHYYFKCPDTKLSNNARTVPGCDLRANGGYVVAPPSSNGNGKAYTWQEGLNLTQVALPELPQSYLSFIKKALSYKNINNNSFNGYIEPVTLVTQMFEKGRRDNDLFHVANHLVKSNMPENEILQVLNILAKNCTPAFPEQDIKTKILSAIKRQQHRTINVTEEIEKWISVTEGAFSITDCFRELQGVTGVTNRNNYRVILHRLKGRGIIERYGNKDGIFRKVNDKAEDIDFLSADTNEIKIKFPFDLDNLVNIYPKNIIVIAGSPNAGKTAFLLNTVEMNMNKHDIYYFSSEMAEQELKLRLGKFDRDLTSWKFHPKDRSRDFADVIEPDAINIIDYLEVHEDFYRIGGMIKDISDKLKKGIAIIALQKDKAKDYGLGATRGLEKARLYITMNPNELKIVKAKNWRNSRNPNGLMLNFKLYQGCKFSVVKDWCT